MEDSFRSERVVCVCVCMIHIQKGESAKARGDATWFDREIAGNCDKGRGEGG